MAIRAAAIAKRDNVLMRRIFIGAMKSRGLKSRTSAALCAESPLVSNRSTSATALPPRARNARNAATPIASGATTPMPLIATRFPMAAPYSTPSTGFRSEYRRARLFPLRNRAARGSSPRARQARRLSSTGQNRPLQHASERDIAAAESVPSSQPSSTRLARARQARRLSSTGREPALQHASEQQRDVAAAES